MAILSKQRTPKGFAEYWVMGRVDVAPFAKTANVILFGFPDKSFADEMGAIPMDTVEVSVMPDRYDEYFSSGDTVENAYRLFSENVIEGATTYDFRQGESLNGK